jgi:quinol monooxygenase YgiN
MSETLQTAHKGIAFHVTYHIAPENVDRFIEALRPGWEATCNIPECIYFDVFHFPAEPGKFRITEVWNRDMEWIEENHIAKDYYQRYRNAVDPIVVKRELEVLGRLQNWCIVKDEYVPRGTGRSY